MKKSNSILMIIVIVIIASLIVWKIGIPNLSSKNKEISSEKVSKKVKKESKKIKKKETRESKSSSSTETSSSMESEPSSESSSESTSSVQPSVKYPALQKYAGKTYYAVDRDSAEVPDMFPTSFTITSDTEALNVDGKQELIRNVTSDSGFIALTGEMGHSMGTTLSFEFRSLGGSDSDAVEVLNQGQRLAYSTTMPE
ncbi:hypothetical protein [Ligilactobacillus salivarius]|uniref:Uncharacterized protein n=1 Tax=Ligilactobacillus salivarius TaxID=1624 RepID=A0A1D7TQW8_9LACO|nr:hypothetical protein [Ligilactobacillus salivarius]AOO73371.1 hypothetical protein BHF65_03700 [Ligilactobacillus salivarius]MDM8222650.1 hypothetical protein [Ligilactobacillus salivarius]MYY38087.1 hypothetical protein [Ligilactobacillus salivarius]OQQ87367.1 hypothetical protein B6U57_06880 [Ligilactobacillus salivarius]OUN19668.1 hypothetical protein B5G36_00235 [Ligilactobacillus salivarius]